MWLVPISYTTQGELDFKTTTPKLFLKERDIILEGFPGRNMFVILNIQQTGELAYVECIEDKH